MTRTKNSSYVNQRCAEECYEFFCQPHNFDVLYRLKQSHPPYKRISWRLLQFASQKTYTELFDNPELRGRLPKLRSHNSERDFKYWVCDVYNEAVSLWGKKNFETYCKEGDAIVFTLDGRSVDTTVAQLNFLRYLIESGALDFIAANIDYFWGVYTHNKNVKRESSARLGARSWVVPTSESNALHLPDSSDESDLASVVTHSSTSLQHGLGALQLGDVATRSQTSTPMPLTELTPPTPHASLALHTPHTPYTPTNSSPSTTASPSTRAHGPVRVHEERRAVKKKKRGHLLAMFVPPPSLGMHQMATPPLATPSMSPLSSLSRLSSSLYTPPLDRSSVVPANTTNFPAVSFASLVTRHGTPSQSTPYSLPQQSHNKNINALLWNAEQNGATETQPATPVTAETASSIAVTPTTEPRQSIRFFRPRLAVPIVRAVSQELAPGRDPMESEIQ